MQIRGLAGIFLLALMFQGVGHAAVINGLKVGEKAPNLIGHTLADDRPYLLKRDMGEPKVINFFWVGCKPCREEMPELAELEKKYPEVKFISVHTQEEEPEKVRAFLRSLSGAPSNIVLTSGGVDQTFRYIGLPHTVVLDSKNVVQATYSGYTKNNMVKLQKILQKLTGH